MFFPVNLREILLGCLVESSNIVKSPSPSIQGRLNRIPVSFTVGQTFLVLMFGVVEVIADYLMETMVATTSTTNRRRLRH